MSRTLFENSKAALAFAAITILGAVTMVGTSETDGVLGVAVDRFGAERKAIASEASEFAEQRSVREKVADPDSGWGSNNSAFGDYNPTEPANQPVTSGAPAGFGPAGQEYSPANAPLAPGAVVLGPDNTGAPETTGVPVITNREMTIEPN
jgi:hypothetical protein